MCGIAGILNSVMSKDVLLASVKKMTDVLSHRGPDREGIFVSENGAYALGHRRLSILDLSHASDQPIFSSCGRYVLVYNGEIYNFHELHKAFGLKTEGHSDTQVLIELIAHLGVEKALSYLNGMFAFAVIDRKERRLYLVRDRVGKKPLYYGYVNSQFVFASELKSFKALPDFSQTISTRAVNLYFKYLNVPAPYSIYENIWKLGPGSFATVPLASPEKIEIKKYWNIRSIASLSKTLVKEDWFPKLEIL